MEGWGEREVRERERVMERVKERVRERRKGCEGRVGEKEEG